MNKTKIEWADYTWNPVTGCLHGCEYCYARRMAKRFSRGTGKGVNPPAYYIPGAGYIRDTEHNSFIENANIHVVKWPMYDEWIIREGEYNYRYDPFPFGFEPTFHRYRLDEPAKKTKGSKVFVCSMADLFGDWVPDEWIQEVFSACEAAPQHKYLFLTKNYLKASNYTYQNNWWIGRTITNKEDSSKLCNGDPWSVDGIHRANHFLSIEPLLGDVEYLKYYLYSFKWVIIGQQTGPGAVSPKDEWVQQIIDQCKVSGVPVFVKSPLYEKFPIQEWPEGLK